jgi:hypothetical protein
VIITKPPVDTVAASTPEITTQPTVDITNTTVNSPPVDAQTPEVIITKPPVDKTYPVIAKPEVDTTAPSTPEIITQPPVDKTNSVNVDTPPLDTTPEIITQVE